MSERPDVTKELARLKGFQRDTVAYAFHCLYESPDSSRRFLVADEVGLGKTLVARGVVARAIDHLWDDIERIDIVYICSNAAIARQNVQRLNMFGESQTHRVDRLTLLPRAVHDLKNNKVNFIAFTPGTSFDLRSSGGRVDERVVLYWLIQDFWAGGGTGAQNLLQGRVLNYPCFRGRLRRFHDEVSLDPTLSEAFAKRVAVAERKAQKSGDTTLHERYEELCHRFGYARKHIPKRDRIDQFHFIGELRNLLAATCVDALEPDLVILDEFQRFRDLLEPNDGAGRLAQQLFEYTDDDSDVRVLMLSATPYKMYTLQHEEEEDDHYEDFLKTFEFVSNSAERTGQLRSLLDDYRKEMYRVGDTGSADRLHHLKDCIEAELGHHISRTERIRSTAEHDGMLREPNLPPPALDVGDVRAFASLQNLAELVEQPGVIEYWKSAPYLLSFMDKYKLKQSVLTRLALGDDEVIDALRAAPELRFDWDAFEAYQRIDPQNARLRWLEQWIDRNAAHRLLWVPPTMPYYRLSGDYDTASRQGFSKQLLFSSWMVVPKVIASMLSYEVERRIFQDFEENPLNTAEERRRRRPLLQFTMSAGRLTGMPVLGILYPSITLVRAGDPHAAAREFGEVPDLRAVRASVERKLSPALDRITRKHVRATGRDDEAWYWAAPILLDLDAAGAATEKWLGRRDLDRTWASSGDDEPDSRWGDHVERAKELLRGEIELGPPPADLLNVMVLMAIASPGVVAARALSGRGLGEVHLQSLHLRDAAAQIAWGMRSLFNKPEAMALLRAGLQGRPYWRLVLEHMASGCVQAVMDEYLHMVRDLEGLGGADEEKMMRGLASAVLEAVTLRTSSARADQFHIEEDEPQWTTRRQVRNHFALRFAAQETEEGSAGARIERVRAAFNSPFWPFVLVTTSFGQEGLDFHAYSHSVVHWNLPSNPVDLEQREGRVNRYKGHAVRKNVAARHAADALSDPRGDPWERLFELAEISSSDTAGGLEPYWVYRGDASIERHVPTLPLSREVPRLEALKRSLAVYRMVFGQPRQDDLMAYLLERLGEKHLRELAPTLQINLSPSS